MSIIKLPIEDELGRNYILNTNSLNSTLDELDEIIDKYISQITYSDDRLLISRTAYGIYVNNSIEGIKDEPFLIIDRVKKYNESSRECKRITNLYKAFLLIAKNKPITAETLNELYLTVVDGILRKKDEEQIIQDFSLGRVARTKEVAVISTKSIDQKMDPEEAERSMRNVLSFIEEQDTNVSPAFNYMISQLLHFMIVYIHPYYNGNGRTSRTVASWNTLNYGNYLGEIGNRGIEINKTLYQNSIKEAIKFKNVNGFLKVMMKFLKIEIKKEYLIKLLQDYIGYELNPEEYILVQCILLTRGDRTYYDFLSTYRRLTGKKADKDFYDNVFEPLLNKGIIVKNGMTSNGPNFRFSLPKEIELFAIQNDTYEKPFHI